VSALKGIGLPPPLSALILTIFAMGLDMCLRRAEQGKPTSLTPTGVGLESELEDYIDSGPSFLGPRLTLIDRQVLTPHGGIPPGHQHIEWWRDEAIPLIVARATRPETEVT
jgi:hypothetical protein